NLTAAKTLRGTAKGKYRAAQRVFMRIHAFIQAHYSDFRCFSRFDGKTKGTREIPIPSELVASLRAWKEKSPKSRLDLVFCNEFGEPCNRTGIGRHGLTPALEQAEIEKAVTMHGL